jgi:hypothetical protein
MAKQGQWVGKKSFWDHSTVLRQNKASDPQTTQHDHCTVTVHCSVMSLHMGKASQCHGRHNANWPAQRIQTNIKQGFSQGGITEEAKGSGAHPPKGGAYRLYFK